ncbi:natterin-4 isoform X1 [Halyomorpha halys]|uniref:natterin-4 isoform X1 n=1 Tax=Halyomorpha halys TaxID=286706 RepID=UPI0006D5213F|nr:natterin-4 isoform X1 [Halyomorpha halys]
MIPASPAQGYVGWIPPSHCVGTLQWVPSSGGQVPPNAVQAGMDQDGGHIYVGRAFHEGDLIPAKVTPRHGCAFVPYNGVEITKMQYEVLCSNHVAWKFCRYGEYPPEAIRIGNTKDGEPLFLGRTMIDGTMTPGKVHPSHRCLYVPYAGREHSFHEYEILILN